MTEAAPDVFLDGAVTLHCGDCLDVLAGMAANSIDSCVTDPPYHLTANKKGGSGDKSVNPNSPAGRSMISTGFMGKAWDGGDIAFQVETWRKVFRTLKPGAHLLAFSGTRTYHRMVCAIEDAGFEIRDQIGWLYGSGFPKSHDVSKGIDRALGFERSKVRIDASKLKNPPNLVGGAVKGDDRPWRESAMERGFHEAVSDEAVSDEAVSWDGWGTALKPAQEPIVLARKPLSESTVAANVLKWGTGALNVDGCRVATGDALGGGGGTTPVADGWDSPFRHNDEAIERHKKLTAEKIKPAEALGRWPANVIHDGSEEVVAAFPESAGEGRFPGKQQNHNPAAWSIMGGNLSPERMMGDSGSAARFFYTAKADGMDRIGSKHPTVKPIDLMQYLVRLVTPKGGTVLDCFSGTGTTGEAAWREGFSAILIEREAEYQKDIRRRMRLCLAGPDERARESIKAKLNGKPQDHGPLFGGSEMSRGGAGRFTDTSPTRTDDRTNRIEAINE